LNRCSICYKQKENTQKTPQRLRGFENSWLGKRSRSWTNRLGGRPKYKAGRRLDGWPLDSCLWKELYDEQRGSQVFFRVHRATQMHFYDAYDKIIVLLHLSWVVWNFRTRTMVIQFSRRSSNITSRSRLGQVGGQSSERKLQQSLVASDRSPFWVSVHDGIDPHKTTRRGTMFGLLDRWILLGNQIGACQESMIIYS
jgi:hypothetical protein